MTMRKPSTLIFLAVNLALFTLSSACDDCPSCEECPSPPPPPPPTYCVDDCVTPPPPPPPPSCDECLTPPPPPPQTPCETSPPPPPPPAPATCPIDVLKLGVCAHLVGGLVDISIGSGTQCCPIFEGLSDLEAANCACNALKANVLGVNLDIKVSLGSILNGCSKTVPSECQCS